jgi:hypothetical protein
MKSMLSFVCLAVVSAIVLAGDKTPAEKMKESISNNKIQICNSSFPNTGVVIIG